jgi:hypothetical protein
MIASIRLERKGGDMLKKLSAISCAMLLVLGVACAANAIPFADANGPYTGFIGEAVTLDGSGSTWSGSNPITLYEWDYDTDGTYDYSSPTQPIWSVVYPAIVPTVYTATIRVTDGIGEVDTFSSSVSITSRDAPPVPEPSTLLLLGSGLVGLAGFRRKFKK